MHWWPNYSLTLKVSERIFRVVVDRHRHARVAVSAIATAILVAIYRRCLHAKIVSSCANSFSAGGRHSVIIVECHFVGKVFWLLRHLHNLVLQLGVVSLFVKHFLGQKGVIHLVYLSRVA